MGFEVLSGYRRLGHGLVVLAAWVVLLFSAAVQPALADCSPYLGKATINELFRLSRGGNELAFTEVKRLDPTIGSDIYHGWTVQLCHPTTGCKQASLANATESLPWMILDQDQISHHYYDLRYGMDVILQDANGAIIDYLSVANWTSDADLLTACDYLYDITANELQVNTFDVNRQADGTGTWSYSSGNSGDDSANDTNDPTADPDAPTLTLSPTVTVSQGEAATLTLTLSEPAGPLGVTAFLMVYDGTARMGVDYAVIPVLPIPVNILAGQTSGSTLIPTLHSGAMVDREFYVIVSSALGAVTVGQFATVTIRGLYAPTHFAIEHDGSAVNCQAEPITITAHDSAHNPFTAFTGTITLTTSTAHGDWEVITGAGTLNNATADDGWATYTYHPNDNGQVVLGLRNTHVETVNIHVTAGALGEDPTEDADLVFARSGFNFLADGTRNAIATQIAGKPSSIAPGSQLIELQAVHTSDETGACEAALTGSTNISLAFECIDPAGCSSRLLTVNENPVGRNDAGTGSLSYATVPLDFGDATDATAPLVIAYPEVGKIKLHARHVLSPSGEPMLGASNEFVVRPFALHVTATGNPGATDAGGAVFTTAGADFTVGVKAVLWEQGDDLDGDGVADGHGAGNDDPGDNADLANNPAALNFGLETTAEQILLSSRLIQPTGSTDPGLVGTLGIASFASGSGSTTVRFHEVGIIELAAKIADDNYLGIGTAATANIGGKSGYVGRFTPARLGVTDNTPVQRWRGGEAYRFGDTVIPTVENGHYYRAVQAGTSAAVGGEPTWPTDGGVVSDNGLVWKDQGTLPAVSLRNWEAGTAYGTGQYVLPTLYNGHFYQATTSGVAGATEPDWPTDGTSVADGGVLWTDMGAISSAHDNGLSLAPLLAWLNDGATPAAFSYFGQNFGFRQNHEPALTVQGLDTQGSITRNYDGTFWKLNRPLSGRTVTNRATTRGAVTVTHTLGAAATVANTSASPPATPYDGTGTLTISGDEFAYGKPDDGDDTNGSPDPEPPVEAALELALAPSDLTDSDGVCFDFNTDGVCDGYRSFSPLRGTELRFGRLVFEDAFGSELQHLAVPLHVQYWEDDQAGFVLNADDITTTGVTLTLRDPDPTYTLLPGDTCAWDTNGASGIGCDPVAEPIPSLVLDYQEPPDMADLEGRFNVWLKAPGKRGSLQVGVTAMPAWLHYDWDEDATTGESAPRDATVTFGRYRGNDRVIYWREVFN